MKSNFYQRAFVVSLIGRPNVGKSSLFNRLMKKQSKALTHDLPGVTRDRHYGLLDLDELSNLDEKDVILVDTGGFYPEVSEGQKSHFKKHHEFFDLMADHAKLAISESDLVLFVVDAREGLNPLDKTIAKSIREQSRPMWLIVNKYDSDAQSGDEVEFYQLGFNQDEIYCLSSAHGLGVKTLREQLHRHIVNFHNKENQTDSQTQTLNSSPPTLQKGISPRQQVVGRIALIGAPNAGKSTLLNQLLDSQRALVSDIAGTTVDPIEGFFDIDFGRQVDVFDHYREEVRYDDHLIEQYEAFRRNHPKVYQEMLSYYTQEEINDSDEWELVEKDEQSFSDEQNNLERAYGEKLHEDLFSKDGDSQAETDLSVPIKQGTFRSVHIVDTAGIRRKSRVEGVIETQSVYRSLRCISESDVVVFLVDASLGIGHQDRRLMDICLEKGKSLIVCMNKIDLLKSQLTSSRERQEWLRNLRDDIPWLNYCDLLSISAKNGTNLEKLKRVIKKTILIRHKKISTSQLNKAVLQLIEANPIVIKKSNGNRFKIKYASMLKSSPPTFIFFSNRSKGIPQNYKRYLKNGLRRKFELDNTPIHIIFRKGGDLDKRLKRVKSSTS